MAEYTLQQAFETEGILTRPQQGLTTFRIDRPGTAKQIDLWVEDVVGGTFFFNVRRHGAPLFTLTADLFAMNAANVYRSKAGLSFPANFGDRYSLDLQIRGTGRVITPITMMIVVEES
jgi:hypothetical protein